MKVRRHSASQQLRLRRSGQDIQPFLHTSPNPLFCSTQEQTNSCNLKLQKAQGSRGKKLLLIRPVPCNHDDFDSFKLSVYESHDSRAQTEPLNACESPDLYSALLYSTCALLSIFRTMSGTHMKRVRCTPASACTRRDPG